MTDHAARRHKHLFLSQELSGNVCGGVFDEVTGLFVSIKQGFNFAAQIRIGGAGFVQKTRSALGRKVERRLKYLIDFLQAFRFHCRLVIVAAHDRATLWRTASHARQSSPKPSTLRKSL